VCVCVLYIAITSTTIRKHKLSRVIHGWKLARGWVLRVAVNLTRLNNIIRSIRAMHARDTQVYSLISFSSAYRRVDGPNEGAGYVLTSLFRCWSVRQIVQKVTDFNGIIGGVRESCMWWCAGKNQSDCGGDHGLDSVFFESMFSIHAYLILRFLETAKNNIFVFGGSLNTLGLLFSYSWLHSTHLRNLAAKFH